jgi:hypothetical protein
MILKAALLSVAAQGLNLRGDCTSGGSTGCIVPLNIDIPDPLNPATIVSTTDSNGFVSAQSVSGDIPNVGPNQSYNGETDQDLALRFTIESPRLDPPPPPPPLITCEYDACTTSTTTGAPAGGIAS